MPLKKQYLDKQGKKKFADIGKDVGEDQKVFICYLCNQQEGKKAPFLAGCKTSYIEARQVVLQVRRQLVKLCTSSMPI